MRDWQGPVKPIVKCEWFAQRLGCMLAVMPICSQDEMQLYDQLCLRPNLQLKSAKGKQNFDFVKMTQTWNHLATVERGEQSPKQYFYKVSAEVSLADTFPYPHHNLRLLLTLASVCPLLAMHRFLNSFSLGRRSGQKEEMSL